MENKVVGDSYNEAKKKAKIFYKSIGRVHCPVLDDEIAFDETGFRHLIQKGRRFRQRGEQKRRFALLTHTQEVLSDPGVSFSHETRNDHPEIQYWAFRATKEKELIKVIVRQIGEGKKHFLSIYSRKQKPAP